MRITSLMKTGNLNTNIHSKQNYFPVPRNPRTAVFIQLISQKY
uniref:Uncharacterized protein n=1 Tax=Arundo donax TaxID=35708 RepID=A0A0A9HQ47_ARUDO